MAPFPESESMTIKRLEVALRKKDMHLLKDGAYKLHEKFHTGHKFEFLSELEQILEYVNTHDIPQEIKEILCPTIDEIINTKNEQQETILQPVINEEDIKLQGPAYEEYIAQQVQKEPENLVENTVEQDDFEHFETPVITQENPTRQTKEDSILFFYDDNSSDIDYSEIKNYRNRLNNLFSSQNHQDDYNLLKEIAVINNLVDTKIFDIDKILNMLKTSKYDVSFITTSQSQDLTKILKENEINFEIPFVQKIDKNIQEGQKTFDFIPMLGLSNIFVCSNCNSRNLKTDFSTKTLSVQCPNCDSASFPDLYAINSYNPDCNPIFWQRALKAFIKSDIWIIVNPPLDENKEIIFDFIKTASDCANPKRIYLFSKENDKREFYKNLFLKSLPDVQILSSFASVEQLCQEFIRIQIANITNEKY